MNIVKRVFISHINEEREVALALQKLIRAQLDGSLLGEVKYFLSSDKRQWSAGEDWLDRIKQELKSADIVILMLSRQSITRHWVNLEAGAAWITGRTLIPVFYSGLEIRDIPRPYSDFDAVNLEDDPYHLLRSLGKDLFYPVPLRPNHEAYISLKEALKNNNERIAKLKG